MGKNDGEIMVSEIHKFLRHAGDDLVRDHKEIT